MKTVLESGESSRNSSEETVFRELFEIYKVKVHSYALYITHAESIAEDITQEVFLKLWLHRQSLNEINNIEAWIITITRNLSFNQLKKRAIEQKLSRSAINCDTEENVNEYISYKDRLNELTQIVSRLPTQQKIIFNLKHNEGLKNEEIACQLNISENTVKSHFYKALSTVRQTLQASPTILIATTFLFKYF